MGLCSCSLSTVEAVHFAILEKLSGSPAECFFRLVFSQSDALQEFASKRKRYMNDITRMFAKIEDENKFRREALEYAKIEGKAILKIILSKGTLTPSPNVEEITFLHTILRADGTPGQVLFFEFICTGDRTCYKDRFHLFCEKTKILDLDLELQQNDPLFRAIIANDIFPAAIITINEIVLDSGLDKYIGNICHEFATPFAKTVLDCRKEIISGGISSVESMIRTLLKNHFFDSIPQKALHTFLEKLADNVLVDVHADHAITALDHVDIGQVLHECLQCLPFGILACKSCLIYADLMTQRGTFNLTDEQFSQEFNAAVGKELFKTTTSFAVGFVVAHMFPHTLPFVVLAGAAACCARTVADELYDDSFRFLIQSEEVRLATAFAILSVDFIDQDNEVRVTIAFLSKYRERVSEKDGKGRVRVECAFGVIKYKKGWSFP